MERDPRQIEMFTQSEVASPNILVELEYGKLFTTLPVHYVQGTDGGCFGVQDIEGWER